MKVLSVGLAECVIFKKGEIYFYCKENSNTVGILLEVQKCCNSVVCMGTFYFPCPPNPQAFGCPCPFCDDNPVNSQVLCVFPKHSLCFVARISIIN